MWAWLIPVLKSALVNFTIESLTDWGTCFATASVSSVNSMSYNIHCWSMVCVSEIFDFWSNVMYLGLGSSDLSLRSDLRLQSNETWVSTDLRLGSNDLRLGSSDLSLRSDLRLQSNDLRLGFLMTWDLDLMTWDLCLMTWDLDLMTWDSSLMTWDLGF